MKCDFTTVGVSPYGIVDRRGFPRNDKTDGSGFPTERTRINGGFFEKSKDNPPAAVGIIVPDICEAMKKVEEAGGKMLSGDPSNPGEPGDIPGVGLYCSFTDTEGNRISTLQQVEM